MATSLKTFFSPSLVRRLAADLQRVHPNFPVRSFVKRASAGLGGLELLDRGRHIARALETSLPPAYPEAVAVLLRSLGPEHPTDELVGVGMAPFFYLPHLLFVAERGLERFDLSMHAQYELTKRFSPESCIRAYIARDPERTLAVPHEWASDGNAHVRRLVSEGTRLRLPWAAHVANCTFRRGHDGLQIAGDEASVGHDQDVVGHVAEAVPHHLVPGRRERALFGRLGGRPGPAPGSNRAP